MKAKARIFISYARADQEQVLKVYQRLDKEGFRPWLDVHDIIAGENWAFAIQQAIRKSDFILVCLSKNSVGRRGMIQKELRMALDVWTERLASDIYLIPVRLEECEVPEALVDFQYVDLFSEDGWARLLKAIQVGRTRRAEVTKPKIVEAVRKNKQAMVKRMRGLIALQSNDLDRAEQNLQEALAIWQELGFDKYIATSLGDLGQLAQKRKRYDAAEQFYRQSVDLARKIDDKEVQTVGLGYEGQFAIGVGRWTEARERCEQALILARKIGHIVVIAQAQFGLARVYEVEGSSDLALPLAQESLRIYERLHHRDLADVRELVDRLLKAGG